MFDLTGKRALITGASGGIGVAIAKALIAQGASCIVSGTRQEKLDALVAELGGAATGIAANLSERDSVEALAKASLEQGGIDILINNAGITRDTLAMRMKDEDWDAVMQVNLHAAFSLSRAMLRPMMKARAGRIINITSVVGTTGNPGQTNYSAAKAALVGMSKSLAQEVASRGITVNAIAPGFIETPMTEALSEDQKAAITTNIPSGTLGAPEDIAAAVCYLASTEARYITGQTLHVNGGMAMI